MGNYCRYADTEIKVKTQVNVFEKRRQVGILGGNFNPVHQAHLVIAEQVHQHLGLDEIRLMPSFLPPHVDPKKTIDAQDRYNMLLLATKGNPHLGIETVELERKGKSYTIDTMRVLKQLHPTTDYYFIIGGDMVDYLPKWRDIDELVKLVQFVGVIRPGYSKRSPYPILWVDSPLMEISSTMIREKVSQGESPRYLLPDLVLEYILQRGLYRG